MVRQLARDMIMNINLTKKDLECILTGATGYYLEPPDEFDDVEHHENYNQWQKTFLKIADALDGMENKKMK